ncbi:MAG: FtsX-like permease family protein [Deltaproteobacteria bacterium]|nr:MAG: FtsX-like permease family protein [Deltaproteobacteria bacterium]
MSGLFARARYFARTSLRGIAATPGTAIVATATITVALVPVGAFGLIVLNMQALLARFGDAVQVTAFLADGLPEADRAKLLRQVRAIDGVAHAELISEAQALERFRGGVGQGFALVEGLGTNPLPASIEIALAGRYRTPADLSRVAATTAGLPGVADITSGADWVAGYVRALALVRGLAFGLGVIFVLATTLIVSNTIRLAVLSRRDELEILSLVGASRSFVNTPFMIEGLLQGAAAGALAWALLYALFRAGLPGVEAGLALVLGGVEPRFFDLGESAWLWGGGAGLGLLGSAIAVAAEARH